MMEALFFWALAMYGALTIVWQAVRGIQHRKITRENPHPMNVILVVHNAESSIEGVLRSVLDRTAFSLRERTVTVVDAWSTDGTGGIVQRLARGRTALTYLRAEDEAQLETVLRVECVAKTAFCCVYDLRRNSSVTEVIDDVSALCR